MQLGTADGPAGARGAGYYSFEVGRWHVVALNSQCSHPIAEPGVPSCAAGSPQERWLRADLDAHPVRCTLAFFHHPLVSSGIPGPNAAIAPLWQALVDHGVEAALVGHDHAYERFAPIDASGGFDELRGVRQFVVGTGGRGLYPFGPAVANSEVRESGTFGVLQMTLRPDGYDWEFVPEAGASFTDRGSGACS